MARNIPYEENHRINENDELQKKCNIHEEYFHGEDPWFPCTDEYFYKVKNKHDGLGTWCKKCSSKKAMKWSEENPDKFTESQEKYKLNPNRPETFKRHNAKIRAEGYFEEYIKRPEVKARKYHEKHKNHDISEKEWLACKDYFKDEDNDWCCAYCGLKIQDHWIRIREKVLRSDFHKEHKDDKGYNDIRNCIPSCRNCNSDKRIIDWEKWYRKQYFFSEERYNKIIKWTNEDYKLYIEDKPPYRIVKKKNKFDNKFHHELWSVDKYRNMIECIHTEITKKDVQEWIEDNPIELVINKEEDIINEL